MSLDILIVDDEEMLRKLETRYIVNFMKKNDVSDYAIDTAEYGQQAVDKIKTKQGKYDLIVLDVRMPGEFSGLDVYQFIKQNFAGQTEAVLWVTGYADDLENFFNSRDIPHITKPFDIRIFHSKIKKYLIDTEKKP